MKIEVTLAREWRGDGSFDFPLQWADGVLPSFPETGTWTLGCLNPDFRERGMHAKFTVSQCQHDEYLDEDDYVNYEEDTFDPQPRGFSKRRRWRRPCVSEQLNNVTSSKNETGKPRLCLTEPSHGALPSNGSTSGPSSNGTSTFSGNPHPADISPSLPETNYDLVSYESFLEDEEELSKNISQDQGALPPGERLASISEQVRGAASSEAGQKQLHQAPSAPDDTVGNKVTNILEVQEPVKEMIGQSGGTLEILEAESQKTTAHPVDLRDSAAFAAGEGSPQGTWSSFHQNDLEHGLGLQDTSSQSADEMPLHLHESRETINTELALSTDPNSSLTLASSSAPSDKPGDNRTSRAGSQSHTGEGSHSSIARLEKRPHKVVSQGFNESFEGENISFPDLGPRRSVEEQILTDVSNSLAEKTGTEEAGELAKGTSLLEATFAHSNDLEPSSYITTEERDELILQAVFQGATATKELLETDSLVIPEPNLVANDTRQHPNGFLNSPEQFQGPGAPAPSTNSPGWKPRQARSLQSRGLVRGLGLPSTTAGSRASPSAGSRAEQDLASQTPEPAVGRRGCGPRSPFCSTRFKKRSLELRGSGAEVEVTQPSLEETGNSTEERGDPQAVPADGAEERLAEGGPALNSSGGAQHSTSSLPTQAVPAASSSGPQDGAMATDLASNWDPVSAVAAGHAGGLQSPALSQLQPGRGAAWGAPWGEQAQGRSQMEEETNAVEQPGLERARFSPRPQQLEANATKGSVPEITSGQSPEEIPVKLASEEDYSLPLSSPELGHSTTEKPAQYVQASPGERQMLGGENALGETGKRGHPEEDGESSSMVGERSHAPGHGENLTLNNLRPEADKPDYDDYGETEQAMEDFDIYEEGEHDPRSFQGRIRQYFIAAVEVMWEYGNQRPQHFLKAM